MVTNSHSSSIPDGWRLAKLGDVGRFANGRAFEPSDWGSSGLPIVRIQNLTDPHAPFNRFDGSVNEDNLIATGDIAVSWSASIEVRTWNRGPAVLNQHIFKVIERGGVVEKRFLFFLLARATVDLRRSVHGTTMQHVTKGTFDSTAALLPPLHEQRRIAEVLDSIDEAIERAESVITSTEQLRDALLHDLLTKGVPGWHTEWKDAPNIGSIPACWEVARLGDVGRWLSGGTPSKLRPDYWQGSIPWISPKDMKKRVLTDAQDHVSEEGARAGSRIAREGAILLVVRGMILAHSFPVAVSRVAAAFNQDIRALECNDNFIADFVLAALQAQKPRLQNLPTPSTHGTMRIETGELLSIEIPLPPLPEQHAIAETLDGVESAIELARTHVSILRSVKESAADALLTGRVRVAGK